MNMRSIMSVAVAVALPAVVACSQHEPDGPGPGDHTPPTVINAVAWDINHMTAVFSETVTRETAENPDNYDVVGGGGPKGAPQPVSGSSTVFLVALHSDNRTVTLSTVPMADGPMLLRVKGVSDVNGNRIFRSLEFPFNGSKANDTTPPEVAYMSPVPGALGVSIGTAVMVEFTEEVVPETVFHGMRVNGDGARLSSIYNYDALHFVCDLDLLNLSTAYTASLKGVTDVAGNQMPDMQWTFETEAVYDTQEPQVLETRPANGEVNVDPSVDLAVLFSEAVDPFSLRLRPSVHPAAVWWSKGGRKVTYSTTWLEGTQYTVQIRPGEMADISGNPSTRLFTLTFSTGPALQKGSFTGKITGDPHSARAADPAGGLVFAGPTSPYDTYTSVVSVVNPDGTYQIPHLGNGTYFPFYIMDSNADQLYLPNYGDAFGIFGITDPRSSQEPATVTIGGTRVPNIDMQIYDPSAVYGFLTYYGERDGLMRVGLFATEGFDPMTSVPVLSITAEWTGTWDYLINSLDNGPLQDGSYYVAAFMDADQNEVFDPSYDPMGVYGGATPIAVDLSQGRDAPNTSIVLNDPAPAAVSLPAVRWPEAVHLGRLKPFLDQIDSTRSR
ncbi:MAG TPA: Ig-like domain-containing protein [Candidatus Krumholzibacteria bacterium]|nr:Ig-like domain-containing protein [Candidatus Krumholzibacteria bacterium]